ncbi:MAG: hypothetical protein KF716_27020 [Anaerolineae bacterium]|nr:hypothetical protein [Anaerolineae bacterium]
MHKRWLRSAWLFGCVMLMLASYGTFTATAQETPTPNLQATIDALQQQQTLQAVSPTPSLTPTLLATGEGASPLLTLTPVVGLTPLPTTEPAVPIAGPPLAINVPKDWQFGFFQSVSGDPATRGKVSWAIYRGKIRAGNVMVIVLWNYPSVSVPATLAPQPGTPTKTPLPLPTTIANLTTTQLQLHSDGLRLLRGTVVDITCNIGNYGLRTDLTVGKLPAIGESFAASQCQSESDVIGWFAGIEQYDEDYLFYVLIDPTDAFNDVALDVQNILDSVQFQPPPVVDVTAAPTNDGRSTPTPP